MNTSHQSSKANKKPEKLETEGPLSEKDEVKAAEEKAAKRNKTVSKIVKENKEQ